MVHKREGGGKISSPNLLKAFGDQKPPKMGRCDLNWVIILFFIYLDALGLEKVEESTHRTVFSGGTQFGEVGFETFWEHFEASNEFFRGKSFPLKSIIFSCYSSHREISNSRRITSIRVRMQKLCHLEVDLSIFTPIVWQDATSTPIIHGKGASHMVWM